MPGQHSQPTPTSLGKGCMIVQVKHATCTYGSNVGSCAFSILATNDKGDGALGTLSTNNIGSGASATLPTTSISNGTLGTLSTNNIGNGAACTLPTNSIGNSALPGSP